MDKAVVLNLTKQVLKGRELRDDFLNINRLRHQGEAQEAAEIAAMLESEEGEPMRNSSITLPVK